MSSLRSGWKTHISFVLLLSYCLYRFFGYLFSTDALTCPDGFFHARFAASLPEHGFSRSFPWLQFTSLKDHFFDNHFLYNVYLFPFCRWASEPLVGAKFATLLLEALILIVFYVLLWRLRVPWPLFWVALLFAGSATFLMRVLMVRSHVLSISLMLLALYAIMRQRIWWCMILGFIYAWSYSAPLAVVCTALGAELGQLFFCGRPEKFPRMTLAVLLGVIAGHLIHPYTPQTLDALWAGLQVTQSAAVGGSLELGREYRPLSLYEMIGGSPGPMLAIVGATVLVLLLKFKAFKARSVSLETALALGAAGGWFLGLFLFRRVIEYAAPLTVLAFALSLRDVIGTRECWSFAVLGTETRQKMLALATALGLALVAGHFWSWLLVETELSASRVLFTSKAEWKHGRFFDKTAVWMRAHIPVGSVVVNFYWDEFPELYYSAPEFYYVGGMDPTLMQMAYPEHSAALESMRIRTRKDGTDRADSPLDLAKLGELFQADYLVMRTYRALKYPELTRPDLGSVRPVYFDQGGVIYKLPRSSR